MGNGEGSPAYEQPKKPEIVNNEAEESARQLIFAIQNGGRLSAEVRTALIAALRSLDYSRAVSASEKVVSDKNKEWLLRRMKKTEQELTAEEREYCDMVISLMQDAELITVYTKLDGSSSGWGVAPLVTPKGYNGDVERGLVKKMTEVIPEEVKRIYIELQPSGNAKRDSGIVLVYQHPDDTNKKILLLSTNTRAVDGANRPTPDENVSLIIKNDNPGLIKMLNGELHPFRFLQAVFTAGKMRFQLETNDSAEAAGKFSYFDNSYRIADIADLRTVVYKNSANEGQMQEFVDASSFVEGLISNCKCGRTPAEIGYKGREIGDSLIGLEINGSPLKNLKHYYESGSLP